MQVNPCKLPYEVWLKIANHLEVKELHNLSEVSKYFFTLCQDKSLWQQRERNRDWLVRHLPNLRPTRHVFTQSVDRMLFVTSDKGICSGRLDEGNRCLQIIASNGEVVRTIPNVPWGLAEENDLSFYGIPNDDLLTIVNHKTLETVTIDLKEQLSQKVLKPQHPINTWVVHFAVVNDSNFVTVCEGGFIAFWEIDRTKMVVVLKGVVDFVPDFPDEEQKGVGEIKRLRFMQVSYFSFRRLGDQLLFFGDAKHPGQVINLQTRRLQLLTSSLSDPLFCYIPPQANSYALYYVTEKGTLQSTKIDEDGKEIVRWEVSLPENVVSDSKFMLQLKHRGLQVNENWILISVEGSYRFSYLFNARTGASLLPSDAALVYPSHYRLSLCGEVLLNINNTKRSIHIHYLPNSTTTTVDLSKYLPEGARYTQVETINRVGSQLLVSTTIKEGEVKSRCILEYTLRRDLLHFKG